MTLSSLVWICGACHSIPAHRAWKFFNDPFRVIAVRQGRNDASGATREVPRLLLDAIILWCCLSLHLRLYVMLGVRAGFLMKLLGFPQPSLGKEVGAMLAIRSRRGVMALK